MFFAEDRIMAVRQMIVAGIGGASEAKRLQQILAMQKGRFQGHLSDYGRFAGDGPPALIHRCMSFSRSAT
jgi:hypothetical protein